jgi:hypothetical protein
MFAIVDRSALTAVSESTPTTTSTTSVPAPGITTIRPQALSGGAGSSSWVIRPGSILTVDSGPKRETLVVTGVDQVAGTFTARFNKSHGNDFPIRLPQPGNQGPLSLFEPRENSAMVPLYVIID